MDENYNHISLLDFRKPQANSNRYSPMMTDVDFGATDEESINDPILWKRKAIDLGPVGVAERYVPTIPPPKEFTPTIKQEMGLVGF